MGFILLLLILKYPNKFFPFSVLPMEDEMIEIKEQYREGPICPYCEQELRSIYLHRIRSILGKRFIYFCPHCRKVLGLSHRKGFWMG